MDSPKKTLDPLPQLFLVGLHPHLGRKAGAFRFVCQGVTTVYHGFFVCALDPVQVSVWGRETR